MYYFMQLILVYIRPTPKQFTQCGFFFVVYDRNIREVIKQYANTLNAAIDSGVDLCEPPVSLISYPSLINLRRVSESPARAASHMLVILKRDGVAMLFRQRELQLYT
jgi:hypothetical protein